jgi:MoaA/NifB/PqqE/SkfB family radical SAM enzyme
MPGDSKPGEDDQAQPLRPPATSAWRMFRDVLDHGGPGYLQFAITNICNARCDFCGFAVDRLDRRQRRSVTLAQARDAIRIARSNHIGYLLFVGGEPLAHPDLPAMVRFCAESGIRPMICTNGSLWTDLNMRQYARDGLSSVVMSIDSHDIALHEKHRGLPDVCRKIQHANQVFHRLGIQTTASVTASRLIEDYTRLPGFLLSLGFTSCTFSYPLTTLGSSYLSFSDSNLVNYRLDELVEVYERILSLRNQNEIHIVNPVASLKDMQRHVQSQPERFPCLGGFKYFHLDWDLNVYRCHAWETPLCGVYEWNPAKWVRDGCMRCMIDCYRDPSVLQYTAISLHDAWQNVRRGRFHAAIRNLLDRRNLVSLRSVWADRHWIGKT